MCCKVCLILSFFILIRCSIFAQEKSEKKDKIENILDKITVPVGGFKMLFLPFVGYEPVTKVAGGIAALATRRLSKDSTLPTSFSELDIVYTQNQQFLVENEGFLYLGDNYMLKGLVGYAKFPDKFWGIGNNTTDAMLQRYDNDRVYVNLHFLRRIHRRFYIGLKYRLFTMQNIKPEKADPATLDGIRGSNGSNSSGLGYTLVWDTRNHILNSQQGHYINIAHSFYGKYTGSTYGFSRFEYDIRKFFKIRNKHILALQSVGVFSAGTPPFNMMALLGSDDDMRGYYRGRYRDMDYLSAQVEYRLPLFWKIGAVGFAGLGNVGHRMVDFDLSKFKYSLGGGLRFLVNKKENINLRIDYAIGLHSEGLYIYLAEAF